MKKTILALSAFSLFFLNAGCSATWDGVKEDSKKAWKSTKETIHETTK